jgi:hypothetical protein
VRSDIPRVGLALPVGVRLFQTIMGALINIEMCFDLQQNDVVKSGMRPYPQEEEMTLTVTWSTTSTFHSPPSCSDTLPSVRVAHSLTPGGVLDVVTRRNTRTDRKYGGKMRK